MIRRDVDVLVIGSGAAGLLTAYYLINRNIRVSVVTKGYGATAMSSGCFDILGMLDNKFLESFREGFDRLPDSHPYRVISMNKLTTLLNLFQSALREANSILDLYMGEVTRNINVITLFGTIKPTALIQKSMKGSILLPDGKYLFLGFNNVFDYNPKLQARMLLSFARIMGFKNIRAFGERINLGINIPSIHFLPVLLRRKKIHDAFMNTLDNLMNKYSPDSILIPPVFDKIEYLKDIQDDFPLYEVPSASPYKAGLRLNRLLWRLVESSGVPIYHAEDLRAIVARREISKITIRKNEKETEIHANIFVLATGDLVGGGLKIVTKKSSLEKELIDSVFGLKIANLSKKTFRDDIFSNHNLSKFGFKINENLQPISESNEPMIDNLYVTGAIIGGYDINEEKSGLGIPLVTAFRLSNLLKKAEV